MRRLSYVRGSVLLLAALYPVSVFAQERASVEGFGGLSLSAQEATPSSLGGTVTFTLTPRLHIVGEAGRLGNVLPALSDAVFSTTGTGLRASALYGEGGIRFVAAPSVAVTPYAEANAG